MINCLEVPYYVHIILMDEISNNLLVAYMSTETENMNLMWNTSKQYT